MKILCFLCKNIEGGAPLTSDQLVAEAATYTKHNKHKRPYIQGLSQNQSHDPRNQSA